MLKPRAPLKTKTVTIWMNISAIQTQSDLAPTQDALCTSFTSATAAVAASSSMSSQNLEEITLVVYDSNVKNDDDMKQTMKELREIYGDVVFHTEEKACVEYINSVTEKKILFIIFGQNVKSILKLVHPLPQIDSIFIFCLKSEKYEHMSDNFPKMVETFSERQKLIDSINQKVDEIEKHKEVFSFYKQHGEKSIRDLSQESAEFLWFQLFKDVILRMEDTGNAKEQLAEFCRHYFHNNREELKIIDEFERNYKPEDSLKWYTRECFLYKLVNKALRTEDIEQLYIFRFFIVDLSRNLAKEFQNIKEKEGHVLFLYRMLRLNKEELLALQQNEGNLMATNGYLSTSRSRETVLSYATKRTKGTNAVPVLYEIECNGNEIESVVFADIAKFSPFSHEQEVLFDIGATFKVVAVKKDEDQNLWIVNLKATDEGINVTKKYIEMYRKENEQIDIPIIFGYLLTDMGKYDQALKYFQNLLKNPQNYNIAAIYNTIGEIYRLKGEFDEALKNFEYSFTLIMYAKPPAIAASATLLNNMANICVARGQYDDSLLLSHEALRIFEEYHGKEHLDTARTLSNIGSIYEFKGNYDLALDYNIRALKIKQKQLPHDHVYIAESLIRIGNLFRRTNNLVPALDYYQRALKMQEKVLPSGHKDIATSLMAIAAVYGEQGQYDLTLEYYSRTLQIQENIFGKNGHPDIALTLRGIGSVYIRLFDYPTALKYLEKALSMIQQLLPSDHPRILDLIDTIKFVKSRL